MSFRNPFPSERFSVHSNLSVVFLTIFFLGYSVVLSPSPSVRRSPVLYMYRWQTEHKPLLNISHPKLRAFVAQCSFITRVVFFSSSSSCGSVNSGRRLRVSLFYFRRSCWFYFHPSNRIEGHKRILQYFTLFGVRAIRASVSWLGRYPTNLGLCRRPGRNPPYPLESYAPHLQLTLLECAKGGVGTNGRGWNVAASVSIRTIAPENK